MPRKTVQSQISTTSFVCVDEESRFKGIPASPGIAIGRCSVMASERHQIVHWRHIPIEQRTTELERYKFAVRTCVMELQETFRLAEQEVGNVAAILETYEFIINDHSINSAIERKILDDGMPADIAVGTEYDTQKALFLQARDVMLRERGHDIENVKERLLGALHNEVTKHALARASIVVASSIIPQDVILFNESEVLAFVTEVGGISSHSCILARTLGIPAVIGVKNISHDVISNTIIIVDGYEGVVISNPKPETIEKYQRKQREQELLLKRLGKLAHLPAETSDNHTISLLANIDSPDEIENALLNGSEGIGLVRTEMLLIKLDRFPTEQEQFEWYNAMAERMYPRPVTFRAYDIGTDKIVQGLPHEHNPALGMRGIRFLLQRKDIYATQLRAILRASRNKNVRLMLPMVSRVSEVEDTLTLLDICKRKLFEQEEDYDNRLPVGIMIETPAAAVMADKFAEIVDFFSIGTNDLTQYTLAADRMNELVAGIFDAFNPAVLRLMKQAVDAAKERNIKVSVCGDLGGHAAATELLVGMGIDELSVSTPLLLELKKRIRKLSLDNAQSVFADAINCLRPSDVRQRVSAVRKKR